MNLFITLLSLILTELLGLEAVPRGIRCKYYEFEVQDVVGNLSCIPCQQCGVGQGLSPQCGSYIPYGTHIECKPCVSGETYSSTNSIESCQPCGICVDHQKVRQKCNTTSNSICEKNCDVGFYLSSIVGDCQECSWCCPNSDPSEHEPQCNKDGVPSFKRCSVEESIRCSPRCTDKQYVIVTETLNQSCHNCPHCSIGRGLYPKCQSVLTSMKESKCQTCIPGKTFSDTTDSSSCKQCKVCGVGKKVERSCNITHDTLCGDCDRGFYNASLGSSDKEMNCEHCSYCCGDDEDVIISECKAQGMPKNMQCAYTTRALTKCAPAPVNKALWISVGVLGLLLIVVLGGVTYKCLNKNKTGYMKMESGESQIETMQDCLPKRERPSRESTLNNIEFRRSGVVVQCPDAQTGDFLLKEMSVEICWEMHRFLPYQEHIFYLSPLIQFNSDPQKLRTAITLDIPHSAYLQEENNTWKIKVLKVPIQKESNHLKLTELSDDTDIKVNPCSVRFKVQDLAAYVVVGEPGDPKHAKKRMQCAVFGATPIAGQTYSTRIYLLDDAESSLEKLEQHEKSEGRHRLKNLFCALHPDVDEKNTIGVAVENVMEGWEEEFSKKVIKCSEWIDSYKTIPKIEVCFKHIDPKVRDFQCTFILNFEDQVVKLPVFHYAEPEHTKTGIQPSEYQQAANDDTPVGISESRIPMNQLRDLSSVPSEVLETFCNSLEQSIGEDPTRIESLAFKIIPSITTEEVITIKESDQPFKSLIDMASKKEITLKVVQQCLEEEGLDPEELMPFLHKENSTPMV